MINLLEAIAEPSKAVNNKITTYILNTANKEDISSDRLGIYIQINSLNKLSFYLFKDKKFFKKIEIKDIINT